MGRWYAWWEGYPSPHGDVCWLHHALDVARHTPGVDGALLAHAASLHRALPLAHTVLDLLERKHLCEHVAPLLLRHRMHTLQDLHDLRLPTLAARTALPPFEAHMLERHVRLEIARHERETRAQKAAKADAEAKKAGTHKDETRRLQQEREPCGR